MDQKYKAAHQQAEKLLFRVETKIDDPGHEAGRQLVEMAKAVREDMECNRSPLSVVGRIEQLKKQLFVHVRQELGVISPIDAKDLYDDYEDLRRVLRGLPN